MPPCPDEVFQEVEHPGRRVAHRHIKATTDDIFGRDNYCPQKKRNAGCAAVRRRR
jgi:hypothetical protein